MNKWPADYEGSWTLAGAISRSGVGLHTGEFCEVRLKPSHKAGFHLSWVNEDAEPLTLNTNQVRDSILCTNLQLGERTLSTVEHLLAALGGSGLTHVEIEVSGEEIPLLDGSSIGWIEAISEAGITPALSPRPLNLTLLEPIVCHRGNSVITATPADEFRLVGAIDFPYGAIGQQIMAISLTPEKFVTEIAPARTFGFLDQVEKLRSDGLIKGASLDNALVCDGDKWVNPPLRFPDEPVRHKLLDLIGDLSLVGFPKAQVMVYRGSHGLHTDFATLLSSLCTDIS